MAMTSIPALATNQPAKKSTARPSGIQATEMARPAAKKGFRALCKTRGHATQTFTKSIRNPVSYRPGAAQSPDPLKVRSNLLLWGSVIYSTPDPSTSEPAHKGIFSVTPGGEFNSLASGAATVANAGGFVADGIYYSVNYYNFMDMIEIVSATKYDTTDWSPIGSISLNGTFNASCLTYDNTTSTVYGCFPNMETLSYWFGKAVYEGTPEVTLISEIPAENSVFNAMFTDDEGQVYGIDMNGDLYKVNKENGAMALVGPTGFVPEYVCGAVYDPKSRKAYWTLAPADEKTYLVEVDPATGAGTLIHQFENDDEITGLAIAPPLAADNAPGKPTSLSIDFENGSLQGTVSFRMPDALYDGTPANGSVKYIIAANGQELATGTADYGADIAKEVAIQSAGNYTLAVYCINDQGEGPKREVSGFFGKDVPKTPVNVKAVWADGQFDVTWGAVTESMNGGYMNLSAIRYNVVRMPDEVVVAENTSETGITDKVEEPADRYVAYYYKVTATCEGNESASACSAATGLGIVIPPYSNTIDSESDFGLFTVIDANGDGSTWEFNNNYSGGPRARCNFSTSNDMDDYLVLPPVKLEAGKAYRFSMNAHSLGDVYRERVEVVYGNAPAAESLTGKVCEPVELMSSEEVYVDGYITPAATGVYYIAVHGISDADNYYLYVDNIAIAGSTSIDVPGAVTDISIMPGAAGAKNATVAFKAPANDINGERLAQLARIEVYRGKDLVKTFDNPAPGEQLSFVDEVQESGTYTYTFKPFTNAGEGKQASATVFIGINIPGEPSDVRVAETSTPGEVSITWTAPETDKDGNPIDASLISYILVQADGEDQVTVRDNLTETNYTYQAIAAGEPQAFRQYVVFAATESGKSKGVASDMVAVGEPYGMPYEESFANNNYSGILGVQALYGSPQWSLYSTGNSDIESDATGDDGFIGMEGAEIGDSGLLFTGKISLADAAKPVASFYVYNTGSDKKNNNNEIAVMVKDSGSGWFQEIDRFTIMDDCYEDGWNQLSVNLEKYAGKTVQIGFRATINKYAVILLDGIKVDNMPDKDIAAGRFTVPATVDPDQEFDVQLTVENRGAKTASEYTVDFFRDDQKIHTFDGVEIASGSRKTFSLPQSFNVSENDSYRYYAVVNCAGDQNPDNDKSMAADVRIKKSGLPMPTDLSAKAENRDITISWKAPDLENAGMDITEDFERYDSFTTEMEGWTFVDGDQSPIGGFQNLEFPIEINSLQSFWIHDSAWDKFRGNSTYSTFSGDKCLASMFRADDGAVDDWAISPKLSGKAQTISFYAKSYSNLYRENVEVLYSTTGTDTDDFKSVDVFQSIPQEWTEYRFDVPEGAKYFAIRSIAEAAFMLMIDDVRYASSASGLTLKGYNVYRDGTRLNSEMLTTPSYTDTQVEPDTHCYHISAVYAEGESRTARIEASWSGISTTEATAASISTTKGSIIIHNAGNKRVCITTTDGKTVLRGTVKDEITVSADKGIYIVNIGNINGKVLVK